MDTNINYSIVGAFVVILCGAIIFGIIWLSSGFALDQFSTYKIYMQESVTGLNTDSAVEFNGVDAGSVKSIELNKKNPQLVEVLLDIKNGIPVTRGTVATLSTKGLTGITFISLKDKSTDLRPLVAAEGQPYPVIKTAPSLFLRLDTALSEVSANLHKVAESVQSLLDKENQKSFKAILINLNRITGTLATDSVKLNSIIRNTAQASQRLEPMLQSSTNVMRTFEMQTLPSTYRLLNNLNEITRTLSEVTAEIKQDPSILIRGVNHPALGPGEK